MRTSSPRLAAVWFLLAAGAVLGDAKAARAQPAATLTWNNFVSVGTQWSVAANWLTNTVPVSGIDNAFWFGSSPLQNGVGYTTTNNLGAFDVNSLVFNSFAAQAGSVTVTNTLAADTVRFNTGSTGTLPSIWQIGTGRVSIRHAVLNSFGITLAGGATGTTLQILGGGLGDVYLDSGITQTGAGASGLLINQTGTRSFNTGSVVRLGGSNSNFTGGVNLTSGNLMLSNVLNTTGAINLTPSVAATSINSLGTGTLTINGGSVQFDPLSISSGASPTGITGTLQVNNAIVLNSALTLTGFAPATAPSGSIVGIFAGPISGAGGITIAPTNGTLVYGFTGAGTFTGPVLIQPVGNTAATLQIGTANVATGSMTGTTAFTVTANSSFTINNVFGVATRLNTTTAPSLTLNRANLNLLGNATANVSEAFGQLTTVGMGSITVLSGSGTAQSATATFASLNRGTDGRGTLSFTVQNMGSGTGAAEGIVIFTSDPGGAIGGGGGAGTTTRSILPYAAANSENLFAGISGTLTPAGTTLNTTFGLATSVNTLGFVRYDAATSRIVPLNLATEYASNLFSTGTTAPSANMRLASTTAAPLTFGAAGVDLATAVNGLIMDTNTAVATQVGVSVQGTGVLTVTGGAVLAATNGNLNVGTVTLPSMLNLGGLDFGTTTGYVHAGTNLTVNAPITGSGGVVKSLTGTLLLNGNNTFTGGLTVAAGVVQFAADANLGAAGQPLILNSGLTTALNFLPTNLFANVTTQNLTVNRPVTVGAGGAVVGVGLTNNQLILPGTIDGPGQFVKGGVGVLTLTGTNTYTGNTTIAAGTLAVNGDAALGAPSGNLIFAGGAFQPLTSFATARDMLVTAGTTIFTNGQNLTASGNITSQTNAPTLLKDGPGDLILTGTNSFVGAFQTGTSAPTVRGTNVAATISAGRTVLSGPNGSLAQASGLLQLGGGELVLDNSGAVGNINNNRVGNVAVSMAGGATTLIGNANGPVVEEIGTLSFAASASAPFGGTVTLSQPVSGGGQLTTLKALTTSAATTVGTLYVRGTNLGGASGDRTALTFSTNPTLSNGVLTAFVGSTVDTGDATTFLTTSTITVPAPNANQFAVAPFTAYTPGAGALGAGGATNTYDVTAASSFTAGATANALRINAGGSLDLGAGTTTLSAGSIITTGGANGGITNGTLAFGANVARINVGSGSDLTVSAGMTGTAGFYKGGGGILTLNTAAGFTTTATVAVGAGTLRYGVANALPVASIVFVNGGATLDLNGNNATIGILQSFGNVNLGSGNLTLDSATAPTIAFGGSFTGTGSITKTNANTVTISGDSSSYAGQVSILSGTVALNSNAGLGTGSILLGDTVGISQALFTLGTTVTNVTNNITVQAGGSATLAHRITAPAGTVTLSGNIAINNNTATATSGGFTLAGVGLDLRGSSGAAGGQITQTGVISGIGGIYYFSGNWTFNGNNTYSGGTFIDTTTAGSTGIGIDSTPTAGVVTSGPFGTGAVSFSTGFGSNLRADGGARTIANQINISATGGYFGVTGTNALTLNGAIDLQGAAVVQSFVITNTATTILGGVIQNGTAGIAKNGPGVLNLTGNNTYTGATTVNAGTLLANNTAGNATTAVTVNSGAILGGSGSVGGALTVAAGGIVSPGNSPGILTINGNATFAANSIFNVELNGATVGVQYDQLLVNGNVDVTGALLSIRTGYSPLITDKFFVVNNTGANPVTGTFAGLPDGSTVTLAPGITATISYFGDAISTATTGGNDIVFFNPVPEPATVLGLAAVGLGLVGFVRRRRAAKAEGAVLAV